MHMLATCDELLLTVIKLALQPTYRGPRLHSAHAHIGRRRGIHTEANAGGRVCVEEAGVQSGWHSCCTGTGEHTDNMLSYKG
jgi:hypothetical protein